MTKIIKVLFVLMTMLFVENLIFAAEKPLIIYFSYYENTNLSNSIDASASASIQLWDGKKTGNTGVVANMIKDKTKGNIFPIVVTDKYPESYNETINIGKNEKSNNFRPKLSTHIENFNDYDTFFIGFPNWWSDMPMALYSFFDEYDFSGKTIIPFITSGGSGFSGIINTIKSLEPNAEILEGISINRREVQESEKNIENWLENLDYSN